MVIVECVALSIDGFERYRGAAGAAAGGESLAGRKDSALPARRPPHCDFRIMRWPYLYYRGSAIPSRRQRPVVFRGDRAARAGVFRRPVLAPATARGAIGGMLAGGAAWIYTLFLAELPGGAPAGLSLLHHGPFGIEALRPQPCSAPICHAPARVLWSLALNILSYVALSLAAPATAIERLQADLFVPQRWRDDADIPALAHHPVTVQDLQSTVAQYLGPDRAGFR